MTIAPWSGWVFEGSGDLPRCWLAIAEWREPASSDRLPVYRSESPTGYSLAGCSPAEPVSASPVADPNNPSLFRRSIKCAARSHGNGADQPAVSLDRTQHRGNADAIGSAAPECHFYFARPVPFLSCADMAALKLAAETQHVEAQYGFYGKLPSLPKRRRPARC